MPSAADTGSSHQSSILCRGDLAAK